MNFYTYDQLLNDLKLIKSDTKIMVGDIISYRGDYSDVCFDLEAEKERTVAELIAMMNDALGEAMTGYKGGSFTIENDAYCYSAYYGCCGQQIKGLAILNGKLSFDFD